MYKVILSALLLTLVTATGAQQLPELKPVLDSQKGQAVIDIPKGRYLLNNAQYGAYQFTDLVNVEIRGNGSEIVCNSQELAFRFFNCTGIKVSGFSVDYDPLCFTQGSIVAMDSARTWFEVEIDPGYPVDHVRNDRVQFYDPVTRELKRNSITTGAGHYTSFDKVAANRFRLVKNAAWVANEKIGDLVVLDVVSSKSNPAAHAIQLEQCTRAMVEDVTVYGSNSFSFFERNCSETHYNRCRVDRGPVQPGMAPRLRSSNADGIHSSLASRGPLVENCEVKHSGDDCIIVCGRSFPVCRIDTASGAIYVLSREGSPIFNAGDTLQHVRYSAVKSGKIKIAGAAAFVPTAAEQDAVISKYPNLLFKTGYTKGVRIVLETLPDSIAVGDIVYNDNHTGKGFVIRNNKVGHNRSRGILIKSSNGEIYSNEITGTAMNAILAAPELHWMGGGFAHNVTISNNTISECMFEKTNKGMPPGVLSVFCANGQLQVPPAGAFGNIGIYGNKISKSPLPGLVFTSVQGLSQQNNEVTEDPGNTREHGKNFGAAFDGPVWEKNNSY